VGWNYKQKGFNNPLVKQEEKFQFSGILASQYKLVDILYLTFAAFSAFLFYIKITL
jgi:hypothetical protein